MKLLKKCRLCRAEGKKLFLKGERCHLPKCSFTRRPYGPGKSKKIPAKLSDYGLQLRAKQVAKRIYGLSEKQLRNYYDQATKAKASTGEKLLELLERRLDNTTYRLGMASSRSAARQLVSHGHILVNDRKINIPSYSVRVGEKIAFAKSIEVKNQASKKSEYIPIWLKLDKKKNSGEVVKLPEQKELNLDIDSQMIVEFYSR